ncbi:MAG: hypothetical protein ACRDRB_04020 [Pseudonocardiaceae bacterium]
MILSAQTVAWLAKHPNALDVVNSVCITLTQLARTSHHPGTLAALRFVLISHQPPTRTGRCPTCPRLSWHQLWRRRPFPCPVWRQIRGELSGHLTIANHQAPRHHKTPAGASHREERNGA